MWLIFLRYITLLWEFCSPALMLHHTWDNWKRMFIPLQWFGIYTSYYVWSLLISSKVLQRLSFGQDIFVSDLQSSWFVKLVCLMLLRKRYAMSLFYYSSDVAGSAPHHLLEKFVSAISSVYWSGFVIMFCIHYVLLLVCYWCIWQCSSYFLVKFVCLCVTD